MYCTSLFFLREKRISFFILCYLYQQKERCAVTQHNVNVGVEDGIKGVMKALKGRKGEIINVLYMLIFPLFDLPSSICITLVFLLSMFKN